MKGRQLRLRCAELACDAAQAMSTDIAAKEIFSLCIMFESWIADGGDATQAKMQLLPEDTATILKLVKP